MQEFLAQQKHASAIAGTGLITLDVVLNSGTSWGICAGGTCGNVLAILAFLGWRSHAFGNLRRDVAGRLVRRDLRRWRVDTRLLESSDPSPTPIMVHRIHANGAGHSFSTRCPECGERLPTFCGISAQAASTVERLPDVQVFFVDRLTAGILALTERFHAQGAVIMFEPSAFGDPNAFEAMLSMTHILKYSSDRFPRLDVKPPHNVLLEVQTLGSAGLRFRMNADEVQSGGWVNLKAFAVGEISDTAGAGDWCSAGIIHGLAGQGLLGLKKASPEAVMAGFRLAQGLAAWNCCFEGARGGIYTSTYNEFRDGILKFTTRLLHPRQKGGFSGVTTVTRPHSGLFRRLVENHPCVLKDKMTN